MSKMGSFVFMRWCTWARAARLVTVSFQAGRTAWETMPIPIAGTGIGGPALSWVTCALTDRLKRSSESDFDSGGPIFGAA